MDRVAYARDIMRPLWLELVQRLDAKVVVHELYTKEVLALKNLQDVLSKPTSQDQAVELLMCMNTRSADDCYKFALLLSDTEGIHDVGCRLLTRCVEVQTTGGNLPSSPCSNLATNQKCMQQLLSRQESFERQPSSHAYLESPYCEISASPVDCLVRARKSYYSCSWKSWLDIPQEACWPWNCVVRIPPNKLVVGDGTDLLTLNLDTNKWKRYNLGDVNIHSVFSCGLGINPYVLLHDKLKSTFAVEKYNLATSDRQHVTNLPSAYQAQLAQYMSVAADDEHLFVVSGRTGTYEALDCVWLYDIGVDFWHRVANMSINRCACSPFVLDRVLYVGGGIVKTQKDDWIGCELVEAFSKAENRWRTAVMTKNTRSRLMPHNGKVLSVGGTRDKEAGNLITSELELINLQTNDSSLISNMSYGRRGHGICVDDENCLFVVGGYNSEGFLTSVESCQINIC